MGEVTKMQTWHFSAVIWSHQCMKCVYVCGFKLEVGLSSNRHRETLSILTKRLTHKCNKISDNVLSVHSSAAFTALIFKYPLYSNKIHSELLNIDPETFNSLSNTNYMEKYLQHRETGWKEQTQTQKVDKEKLGSTRCEKSSATNIPDSVDPRSTGVLKLIHDDVASFICIHTLTKKMKEKKNCFTS